MQIAVSENTIEPDLRRRIRVLGSSGNAMQSVGVELVSMANGAFSDPALRPTPWAPLKPETIEQKHKLGFGSEPLIASGALARSPRIIERGSKHVVVGTDRAVGNYSLGAIHQHGAPAAGIPARPFFPFTGDGTPIAQAKKRVRDILLAWLK